MKAVGNLDSEIVNFLDFSVKDNDSRGDSSDFDGNHGGSTGADPCENQRAFGSQAVESRELFCGELDNCLGAVYDGVAEESLAEKIFIRHGDAVDNLDQVLSLDWFLEFSNVEHYIGESTSKEIAYAKKTGKPVRYLLPKEA